MASTTPVRGQPQQWERGESVAYSEQDPESHHHGKPTMERPGESRDLPIPRRATEATHSTTNDLKDSKATWNTTECTRHPDKGQRSHTTTANEDRRCTVAEYSATANPRARYTEVVSRKLRLCKYPRDQKLQTGNWKADGSEAHPATSGCERLP